MDPAAETEDALRVLRELGERSGLVAALKPVRERTFCSTGDFVFAESLSPAVRERAERLLRHRWSGDTHFDLPVVARVTGRNRADAVLLGARRTTTLRLRAFVFGWPARTLAVQQRVEADRPTAMLTGAGHQRTARRLLGDRVPRVTGSGTATLGDGRVLDWVTEDLVDGTVVPWTETEPALVELLALLDRGWTGQVAESSIGHESLRPAQRRRAVDGLTDLITDPPRQAWPADVDAAALLRRAERLLARPRPVTVGLTHGDPSVGNVLRDRQGSLLLLDWEFAGRRMLAHDVAKVLRSSTDPVPLAESLTTPSALAPLIRAERALPWRSQVAVGLLVFGASWRDRYDRAAARSLGPRHARSIARSIRLIDALLDD